MAVDRVFQSLLTMQIQVPGCEFHNSFTSTRWWWKCRYHETQKVCGATTRTSVLRKSRTSFVHELWSSTRSLFTRSRATRLAYGLSALAPTARKSSLSMTKVAWASRVFVSAETIEAILIIIPGMRPRVAIIQTYLSFCDYLLFPRSISVYLTEFDLDLTAVFRHVFGRSCLTEYYSSTCHVFNEVPSVQAWKFTGYQ